jgi:glutathione synthase/RimK-type ligase-like ATP-grasp enzyme
LSVSAKEREFVNNECSAGVTSVLSSGGFRGKWVSHPEATAKACDKVFQLQAALECGFRIPATLVSQSKAEVIEFYETYGGKIIVKPLLGVAEPFLVARMLDDPSLLSDEAYSACPAIYQEFIPGTRHLRLNSFGPIQVAAVIESEDLDWRPNLNVPIYRWAIPPDVETRVQRVLQSLGLEMGIIDLKLTPDGEIVWFEVNPQGQFLFLEPFIKTDLSGCLARFLIDCAS